MRRPRAIPSATLFTFLALSPASGLASASPETLSDGRESTTTSDGLVSEQPTNTDANQAIERLRALSVHQQTAPAMVDPSLPIPPMLNPLAVERVLAAGQANSDTTIALADLLVKLSEAKPAGEPLTFPSATPTSAHLRSVQMYVQGRSKLYSGDVAAAATDLDTATRLDPQAAEPWLALAEAQLMQGKRLSAMVSYQQAARRGTGQARALWFLGRDALRNGKPKLAAEYLAQARANDPKSSDAALPYLVDADLAEALQRTGHLHAAGEALESALDLPDQFGSVTRLRNELADLYRRRGELWRDLGDLQARLGDLKASAEAYAESNSVPMLDPGSMLPRRVNALLRLGRSADAGLAVIDSVERAGWFADERAIAVCGFVFKHAGLGASFADAVNELADAHAIGATLSQGMSLARLRAAAAEPGRARAILLEAISKRPSDSAAIADFIAVLDPSGLVIAEELRGVLESGRFNAANIAEAVVETVTDVDVITADLSKDPVSDAAALIHSAILERTGRPREAGSLLAGRAWGDALKLPGLRAQVRVAMKTGRFDDAESAYSLLKAADDETPESSRSVAAAALDLQRPGDVLDPARLTWARGDRSEPVLVDECLVAATASLMLDQTADVVDFLNRAIHADRFDERSYEGLFRVYAPPGEQPDNEKIGDVARRLRQSLPSSRVIRLLTAQEFMQRRDDLSAEELLRGVVDERLSDATAGSALVTVWEARAAGARADAKGAAAVMPESVARGEAWLREQVAKHPEHAWLWTGLARMLTVQGKPEEAEKVLETRQQARPWPQFGQMRETILRDWLLKPDLYAAAARARLEPAPRGIDESFEYAELLIGQKKTEEAAAVLRSGMPRSEDEDEVASKFMLTQDQTARFIGILGRVARDWEKKTPVSDRGVAQLFDLASERRALLPASLYEFRLRALASLPTPDAAAITRALAEACVRYPGQSSAFYGSVAGAQLQAGRGKEALPFLRSAVSTSSSPSAELLFALVQQTATVGEEQDFQLVIDQLTNPQQIALVLKAMSSEDVPPTEPAALRGQLAYRMGSFYSFLGRNELSTRAKQVALKFNPDLAWAKNDLGYQLLEDGGDFAEAARLIEEAYAALPNEPSIIDSIGWIRYHQGVLEDQPAAGDRPMVEGAITLLRKAVETGTGKTNGTLHDHLAEALWAARKRDEAKEVWTKAETLLSEDVNLLKKSASTPEAALTRANKELDGVRGKRRAAAEGTEPAITPMRSQKQAQIK